MWDVLYYVTWLSIEKIDVFEDSKVVIDWDMNKSTFFPPLLSNWMHRISLLIENFSEVNFAHIYRGQNGVVDALQKAEHRYHPGEINFYAYPIN